MDDFDDITCEEFYHDELERDCDEAYEPEYDDSMDGDFDSAMASAGWGTDEDYVADNDYFDDVPF